MFCPYNEVDSEFLVYNILYWLKHLLGCHDFTGREVCVYKGQQVCLEARGKLVECV